MKKILKYFGSVLGCLSCLGLFIAPFALVVSSSLTNSSSSESYGLFADLSGISDLYKIADKTFQSFWVTLFQIAVITSLVLAVVMLLVGILNDLGVMKAKKVEKVLAVLLLVVGIVGLVSVALCSILNVYTVEVMKVKTTTKFVGTLIGWLLPVFSLVGGILAYFGSSQKSKKKKR